MSAASSTPAVSVIIPTHNHARFLNETIDSVISRSDPDLEIIVIDNGSTDGTRKVVSGIRDSRLRYEYQDDSGLPANSRNNGIKLARGEWVALLDSDDVWLPDKLEKQLSYAEAHGARFVCTNAVFFDSETGAELGLAHKPGDRVIGFDEEFMRNRVVCSTVLVQRKLIEECGYFDEDPALRGVEDHDLWLKISRVTDLHFLGEPLVRYRMHSNNLSADGSRNLEKELLVFEKWREQVDPKLRRLRLSRILFSMGRMLLSRGDKQAVTMFRRSALTAMTDPRAWAVSLLSRLPFPLFRSIFGIIFRARSVGLFSIERK